jgi:hypothetical protein
VQQDLVLAKGGALRKYAGDEDEYKLALAAHAASMWGGSAAGSAPPQESMLDALQKRQPKDAPAANSPPPPCHPARGREAQVCHASGHPRRRGCDSGADASHHR